jgi:hypothetical protein
VVVFPEEDFSCWQGLSIRADMSGLGEILACAKCAPKKTTKKKAKKKAKK